MPTALMPRETVDASTVERVLIHGDLKQLTPAQKVSYYNAVCESVGLNPLTQPFQYLVLNGREILYALRAATEQLRQIHSVSIQIMAREVMEDCYVVTARATLPSGRQDENIGAVPIANLKGEARANAMMKAETKAKRRVTLAICGLGMLDETEVETIPNVIIEAPPQSGVPTTISVVSPELVEDGGLPIVPVVDLPPGAVLITKVEGGAGKAKGFLHHSGQTVSLHGNDGIAIYDDPLVTIAAEVCQSREPVVLELKTPASGKHYVKAIRRVQRTDDDVAEHDFPDEPPF